jgi:hypothetical protein
MFPFLLLGCAQIVLGLAIDAEVTCAPGETTQCRDPGYPMPCRCNPPHWVEEEQVVEVVDYQLTAGTNVVFSLDYSSEWAQCGRDGVVEESAVQIESALDAPLYEIDAEASLAPLSNAEITEDGLQFTYTDGDATYTELHTVRFRDAVEARPYHDFFGCCSAIGTQAAAVMSSLLAGLALIARRKP